MLLYNAEHSVVATESESEHEKEPAQIIIIMGIYRENELQDH